MERRYIQIQKCVTLDLVFSRIHSDSKFLLFLLFQAILHYDDTMLKRFFMSWKHKTIEAVQEAENEVIQKYR